VGFSSLSGRGAGCCRGGRSFRLGLKSLLGLVGARGLELYPSGRKATWPWLSGGGAEHDFLGSRSLYTVQHTLLIIDEHCAWQ
jgi:hypothetical protein